MAQKISITLSDDLHDRLSRFRDEIVVSAVCERALRREVEAREAEEARLAGRRAVMELAIPEVAPEDKPDLSLIRDAAIPDHIAAAFEEGVADQVARLQKINIDAFASKEVSYLLQGMPRISESTSQYFERLKKTSASKLLERAAQPAARGRPKRTKRDDSQMSLDEAEGPKQPVAAPAPRISTPANPVGYMNDLAMKVAQGDADRLKAEGAFAVAVLKTEHGPIVKYTDAEGRRVRRRYNRLTGSYTETFDPADESPTPRSQPQDREEGQTERSEKRSDVDIDI